MTLAFRRALPADHAFVCDAWARSLRLSKTAGFIDMDRWQAIAYAQATRYIERPYVSTIIAYEPAAWASAADIYGFLVADTTGDLPLVYFVYVKDEYRKHGYAQALFAAAEIDPRGRFDYLCSTPAVHHIALAGKIPFAKWNPIPARFGREKAKRRG